MRDHELVYSDGNRAAPTHLSFCTTPNISPRITTYHDTAKFASVSTKTSGERNLDLRI
jgi:hypothetical protein